MDHMREPTSRVGRENQVYDVNGARLVAGGVILNESKEKVLMITSTNNKNKWILPKGGVEIDERDDYSKTALRECWEEAGVEGQVVRFLGQVEDMRNTVLAKDVDYVQGRNDFITTSGKKVFPKTIYFWYEMDQAVLHEKWPEVDRKRRWVGYEECVKELEKSKRSEAIVALDRSSIKKNVV